MTANANPVDVTDLLDYEIVRAQMVNCVQLAVNLLSQSNPGLGLTVIWGRLGDQGVVFTLNNSQGESRIYLFRLINPDGTNANLARLNEKSEQVPLDNFDGALIESIAKSLAPTVAASYHQMVKEPVKPTHPGVPVYQ